MGANTNPRLAAALMALAAALVVAGCSRPVYIEQETPPGTVPPAENRAPGGPQNNPELNRPQRDPNAPEPIEGAVAVQEISGIEPGAFPAPDSPTYATAEAVERFRKAYAQEGRPSLVFLLARTAAAPDWKAPATVRLAAAGTDAAVGAAYLIESASGSWIAGLQTGFLDPFTQAKARIVDRAALGDGTEAAAPDVMKLDSLTKRADLVVWLFVECPPAAADVCTARAAVRPAGKEQALAEAAPPDPKAAVPAEESRARETGGTLAVGLMNALTAAWEKE